MLEDVFDKKRKELYGSKWESKLCGTHIICYFCKKQIIIRNHHFAEVDDMIVVAANPSRYLLIDEVTTCGCQSTSTSKIYEIHRNVPHILTHNVSLSVYNLRHRYHIQFQDGNKPGWSFIQRRATDFPRYDMYYYDDMHEITLFHILAKTLNFNISIA